VGWLLSQISTSQRDICVPADLRTFLLFIVDLFFNNRKLNFEGILLVQYHKVVIISKISGLGLSAIGQEKCTSC
jgi:hypothetical protein